MNPASTPAGTGPCVACGYQVARRDKSGNISISIAVNPGVNITLRGPICHGCAGMAKGSPEGALGVLRTAVPHMLDRQESGE